MGRVDEILDIAQDLIQTGGYNAFSFQDIAKRLGIKKASIQFYFSKKEDLGKEVVSRYCNLAAEFQEHPEDHPERTASEMLDHYLKPFLVVSDAEMKVCLCGVLGGEYVTLPPAVQEEVTRFFDVQERRLAYILEKGRKEGVFRFKGEARPVANAMFASLEGALLVARTRQDPKHFDEVVKVHLDLLAA